MADEYIPLMLRLASERHATETRKGKVRGPRIDPVDCMLGVAEMLVTTAQTILKDRLARERAAAKKRGK